MIDMEFLLTIDKLPEVGVQILRRRDGVLSLLSSAEDLRRRADLIEDQAFQAQNALKDRVAKLWSDTGQQPIHATTHIHRFDS